MFSVMIHALGSITIGIIFGTYIMQWLSLVFDVLENNIENKRQILWRAIPGGFVLLVVWKWKEFKEKEEVRCQKQKKN